VDRVISCDPALRPEVLLTLAASGELHSVHPLALAVVRHARDNELEIPVHEECEVIVGRGMRVDFHGNRILVGSQQLMADFGVVVPPQVVTEAQALRKHGQSVLHVGINDRLRGLIGIVDIIRPEARQLLQSLQRAGIRRLAMLTGDSREAAEIVAQELGVDAFQARLLPEDKLRLVRELQHHGYHVALASNELGGVVMVIDLSQHTLSVVKWNYALALGLNGLGIAVGALGALNPILAAVLHNLSTVAVVLNSSRLIGYQPLADGRRARARS
jgi:cation-transporting P-type ATPase C